MDCSWLGWQSDVLEAFFSVLVDVLFALLSAGFMMKS